VCLYLTTEYSVPFPFLLMPQPSVDNEPSMFMFPYQAGTNYGLASNLVPNDEYATAPRHPTGKQIGAFGIDEYNRAELNDQRVRDYIYADSTYSVRNLHEALDVSWRPPADSAYPPIVASPNYGTMAKEPEMAGTGHHWGYASCEWLAHCDGTNTASVQTGTMVGSSCEVDRRDTQIFGYCFESSTGSLECGRAIDITDQYNGVRGSADPNPKHQLTHTAASGDMPASTGNSGDMSGVKKNLHTTFLDGVGYRGADRCPRGTDATGIGISVTKRLKIGGCMIMADQNFTVTAEVHVPQMCSVPADYHKGCMFPGATNYDPNARQSGDCHYLTHGCTDSTAVNFNAESSIDDGSCIAAVFGCTVHNEGYWQVQPTTPDYKDRFVGVPLRAIGHVDHNTYGSVLYYNSEANVLDTSCVVTIEGCMDSLAINYDPHANVNSRTWCVMPVPGCMMPTTPFSNGLYDGSGGKPHTRDGLATNFAFDATVSAPETCVIERFGCTDSLANNYDPHATVNFDCYPEVSVCLDNAAINFNCTGRGYDDSNGNYIGYTAACTDFELYSPGPRGTTHAQDLCILGVSPPPPPGGVTSGKILSVEMVTDFIFAGGCEDIVLVELVLAYVSSLGDELFSGTTAEETCGSVNVKFRTPMASMDAFNAASNTVSSTFNNLASINSALGVEALALPTVVANIQYGGSDNTAAVVGGAVGGTLGGLCLIAGIIFMVRKSKKVEA